MAARGCSTISIKPFFKAGKWKRAQEKPSPFIRKFRDFLKAQYTGCLYLTDQILDHMATQSCKGHERRGVFLTRYIDIQHISNSKRIIVSKERELNIG